MYSGGSSGSGFLSSASKTYSDEAPKHKGIVARMQEKEEQEQALQADKEKDALMKEAMSDPLFKL